MVNECWSLPTPASLKHTNIDIKIYLVNNSQSTVSWSKKFLHWLDSVSSNPWVRDKINTRPLPGETHTSILKPAGCWRYRYFLFALQAFNTRFSINIKLTVFPLLEQSRKWNWCFQSVSSIFLFFICYCNTIDLNERNPHLISTENQVLSVKIWDLKFYLSHIHLKMTLPGVEIEYSRLKLNWNWTFFL